MVSLSILNPWWKGKGYLHEDKHLRDLEACRYQWRPPLLDTLQLVPNNIFTLRGPRQVGKTTFVKLLIRGLLEKGVPETAILYWNCDEILHFRELSSLLREYAEFAHQHQERYIFLDEISRVKDWQRSIKSMVDSGELEHCCVLLTGSHTLDIKYGMERLPGRTGIKGKEMLLLPLSFSEYVALVKPELPIRKVSQLSVAEINEALRDNKPFEGELRMLFRQYLLTGGFPLVINEFLSKGSVPDYVYELYSRWVVGDLAKWGKQEKILMQLLRSVITKQSTAVSWDSLAKEAEIKSHKTVSAYIEDLENMFVLLVLYFWDADHNRVDYSKNKKIYFLDPFVYHVFNRQLYFQENEVNPALVEATVLSNLARKTYVRLSPSIYYWKGKKEVDALLRMGKDIFPCEVKYQSRISKQDYEGLYHFHQGVLITKDYTLVGEKYTAIPAHLLLSMI